MPEIERVHIIRLRIIEVWGSLLLRILLLNYLAVLHINIVAQCGLKSHSVPQLLYIPQTLYDMQIPSLVSDIPYT
jgi:hypothetical protein